MCPNQDKIFSTPLRQINDFHFDEKVASVFPDMISRSVPGYAQILNTIGSLAAKYAQKESRIYDLGCSLGAATLAIRRQITDPSIELIAVDNSEAMIQRAAEHLNAFVSVVPLQLVCADIQTIEIKNASLVILNFTLQFLPPSDREALIQKIYRGLKPGGILVISEKILFSEPAVNSLIDDLHLDFKRANGYSELEISQKRTALENVMKPESLQAHQDRLQQAGFSATDVWFQCFNFASMVAIK